ncbi:helix-turn-helix transcriptional regulator [Halopiger thermotolerans]
MSPSSHATVQSQTQTPLPAADPKQIIRLNVSSDGDVRWEIESRFLITDDDDADTFREFADAVKTGRIDSGYDVQLFERYVTQAETATGREMELRNAGWDEPEIRQPESDEFDDGTRIGVITYSFTWTNFATVDGDRIYFGDALQTPDNETGSWLPLYDGQRLVVEAPPNYALETPTSLSWDGPHQFEEGDLEIVFLRGPSDMGAMLPGSVWLVGSAIGVLIAAGIGGYFAYRYATRSDRSELPIDRIPLLERVQGHTSSATNAGSDPDVGGDGTESATDIGAHSTSETAAASQTQLEYEEADDDIDPELLSDEERVHRMLKRNGGRMKQATIVKETGWSNAKVSQLLSQMDEDGEIDKLRIGRENLITLPEVDPTEVD